MKKIFVCAAMVVALACKSKTNCKGTADTADTKDEVNKTATDSRA
jgi:hypothetical protein